MDTTIEIFSPGLEPAIIALILPIQQQELAVPIRAEDQPDLQNVAAVYQSGHGNFWVAREKTSGDLVGTIGLIDFGSGGALRKMFVRADQRGTGTAQALLDRLLRHAEAHALGALYLGTLAQMHAAHRFYERNEFRRIEPALLPAAFPRMAVDNRFYMRRV